MRYAYDCEFLERPGSIDLVSIAFVAEDGRELYAINADMPVDDVLDHTFLRREVWPHLPTCGDPLYDPEDGRLLGGSDLDRTHPEVMPYAEIGPKVRDFLLSPGTPVELWAYVAAFDHVCLAWLFGPMAELPDGIPWWTRDIKDWKIRLGDPELPKQLDGAHDALADARHNWVRIEALEEIERGRVRAHLIPPAREALDETVESLQVNRATVTNQALQVYGFLVREVWGKGQQLAAAHEDGTGQVIEVELSEESLPS